MAEGEPNPVTLKSPTGDSPVAAEPIPEWGPALQSWQWAWEFHWIGFGTLFTVFTLYSTISLIDIIKVKSKTKRGHLAIVITTLLVILGISRALYLFINPYESEQCNFLPSCPVMLSRILFAIALPCTTASFSLVHLAFLQVMKLKLYPEKLQSTKFLSCIISFHFGLTLLTEVMLSLFADMKTLSIFCQSFFIVFYFTISVSFIYSGTKIVTYVTRNHTYVTRVGERSMCTQSCNGLSNDAKNAGKSSTRSYRPNVSKLVKITYITVSLGFASCALQLYSMFGVHHMYKNEEMSPPKPWPWLIFQSLYRAVEFAAGCTLAYVGPRQISRKSYPLMRCFVCCRHVRERSGTEKPDSSNDAQSSEKHLTSYVRDSAA